MYLCDFESYIVTVCTGYLVLSIPYVVTVQFSTRCLADRFLHKPNDSGWIPNNVCDRCRLYRAVH